MAQRPGVMKPLIVPIRFLNRQHLPEMCPYTGDQRDLVPHRLGVEPPEEFVPDVPDDNGIWIAKRMVAPIRRARYFPPVSAVFSVVLVAVLVYLSLPFIRESQMPLRYVAYGAVGLAGGLIALGQGIGKILTPKTFRLGTRIDDRFVQLYFADPTIQQVFAAKLTEFCKRFDLTDLPDNPLYARLLQKQGTQNNPETDADWQPESSRKEAGQGYMQRLRQRRSADRDPD